MPTFLRPKSFRGDQIGAGVAVLTVFVTLSSIRFADDWSDTALVLFSAVAAAFVATLAVLAPAEGTTPRAYQTVLYVSTYVLCLTAFIVFALTYGDGDGNGSGPPAERTVALVAAIMAAIAGSFAIRRGSPTATLLTATSVGVCIVATVVWVADAELQAVRWVLTILIVAFALGVVSLRDQHPAHAGQLANAGGVAALAITIPDLYFTLFFGYGYDDGGAYLFDAGWGWELVVLAAGFGLVSYGAVDHERGPAGIGVAVLAAFVGLAALSGDDADFVGWPLALALVAAGLLVVGLRPTTPAPPEPELPGRGSAAQAIGLPPREPPEF